MKPAQQKVHYLFSSLILISLLGLSIISKQSSLTSAYKKLYRTDNDDGLFTVSSECVDIGLQKDQCKFVQSNCDGFNLIYLELYYCSNYWRPISVAILISCLLLLFGAISVVASDFFCPNLQTISSKLQLSESMAGVTILAFGNGSPDLFSTFSALDSNAGSLAIGELIGAAFFIVAVVSGCMGIIKPFQSQKITFMRDASYLTGAIMIISWIVYHQRITWYHSALLILYYLSYVCVVLVSAYNNGKNDDFTDIKLKTEQMTPTININESTQLLYQGDDGSLKLSIPTKGFSDQPNNKSDYNIQNHLGHIIRPTSPNSARTSLNFDSTIPRSTSTNGSIISSKAYRRPMTPRIGIRTSVFGAIEFQEQVNNIRRANSSLSLLPINKRYRQNSMPSSTWQMAPGTQHIPIPYVNRSQQQHLYRHCQPNENFGRVGLGRPRAFTMTDRLLTIAGQSTMSPPVINLPAVIAVPDTQDYFTYLSSHQQSHFIYVQASSPPPSNTHLETPEITIPEIRLAPPNNDDRTSSPDYITEQRNNLHYGASQSSRGASTHSLAPPSALSENDDSSFFSARQSFQLSPSNSFDHQSQLLSAVMNNVQLDEVIASADDAHTPITTDTFQQLNIPNENHGIVDHYRNNSECSFNSKHFIPKSKLRCILDEVAQLMFPTLQGWGEKSLFSKINSVAAAPLVILFTLTLPVAEIDQIKVDDVEVVVDDLENEEEEVVVVTNSNADSTLRINKYLSVPAETLENDIIATGKVVVDDVDTKQGWNKYLLVVQSIVSTTFIFGVFVVNEVIPFSMIILGVLLGVLFSLFIIKSTKSDEPPSWFWIFSFIGFFVALNWIFLLANEVVGLLQALGEIFSISDAIMGLTVFALGNSIGDFVANTAIAKMGFPTMAISACYAGPLLNMVLGIGISSFYQIWKSGHAYELDIAPTIMVSSMGLLIVLVSTITVVSVNGYHVTKRLGWWMICVYLICCTTNFMLEFRILF